MKLPIITPAGHMHLVDGFGRHSDTPPNCIALYANGNTLGNVNYRAEHVADYVLSRMRKHFQEKSPVTVKENTKILCSESITTRQTLYNWFQMPTDEEVEKLVREPVYDERTERWIEMLVHTRLMELTGARSGPGTQRIINSIMVQIPKEQVEYVQRRVESIVKAQTTR